MAEKNDLHQLVADFKEAAGEGMSSFARQVQIQADEALRSAQVNGPQTIRLAGQSIATLKLGSPDEMFEVPDVQAVQVSAADALAAGGQSLFTKGSLPPVQIPKQQKKESHKKTVVLTGQDVIETLLRMQ